MVSYKDKIAVFYHLCTIGPWESIFREQMGLLLSSGLYEKAEYIYVCVVGATKYFTLMTETINKLDKIKPMWCGSASAWEFPTLLQLYKFAKFHKENYKVLYFHGKGVSHTDPDIFRNTIDWRKMMEYF